MKCSMLIGCCTCVINFFYFQIFVYGFQAGPKFGYKFWILEKILASFGDKFQCTCNLGVF